MAGFETKEDMAKVITLWIEKMKADPSIARRCKGVNVTMGYEITDLDFAFHTDFIDGVVDGGLGEADPPSKVFLEMESATFDGMMTGEVDAASAAMSGEMSFSGDMSAAMGLQALQEDLTRMYLEARE
ncbi:MAG: SCP2 sterol-binding domain-containing protein [Chloroflexi bacterium]|nr:SCP2 sterol-binding domain-containing protein [Chloroflexota bacterium]